MAEIKPRDTKNEGDSKSFFDHLKNQVNGWIAAGALIPTGITWKGMPMYEAHKSILLSATGLFCAFTMGFLFLNRNFIPKAKSSLGKIVFSLVVLMFIAASVFCFFAYYTTLMHSIDSTSLPQDQVLRTFSINTIHDGTYLIVYYLLTMIFANCAMFLMAYRDWKP